MMVFVQLKQEVVFLPHYAQGYPNRSGKVNGEVTVFCPEKYCIFLRRWITFESLKTTQSKTALENIMVAC